MKICIVGTGISGLVAAHRLHGKHDLCIYEAASRLGGHTHTVDIVAEPSPIRVDTGFVVFNEKTYPGFCGLLKELGVPWQKSNMSFSVSCAETGLEYNGTNFNGLFAQRSNLLRPSFWGMVRDIMRFYREAPVTLNSPDDGTTLGDYLDTNKYSKLFVEKHLIPMGAAVWSATPDTMRRFPLRFLVQFFHNHGFMQVSDRPDWLVVKGGSNEYVRRIVEPFKDRIHLGSAVKLLERTPVGVRVVTSNGDDQVFDRVILATHADTSLKIMKDASPLEKEILGAFRFQRNEVLLHSDERLMPRRRRAWASWNYHVRDNQQDLPSVTYWMNRLQGFDSLNQFMVTLNRSDEVRVNHVLGSYVYHHPIFSSETTKAQARHGEIDGKNGVHFCGAYWRYGFHEDGVQSAFQVVENLEVGVLV
jgi:predicted NAD/FAD-binding protein